METIFNQQIINIKNNNIFSSIKENELDAFWKNINFHDSYIIKIVDDISNEQNIENKNELLILSCYLEVIIYSTKIYLLEDPNFVIQLHILNIISYCIMYVLKISNIDNKDIIKKLNLVETLNIKSLADLDIRKPDLYKKYHREFIFNSIKIILSFTKNNTNKAFYYLNKYFDEKYLSV